MDPEKMRVQVRKDLKGADGARSYTPGVLIGSRYMTPDDGPFEVDHKMARRLIMEGAVEAVAQKPVERAERAVEQKPAGSKR